jgi:hypothetical protein
MSDSAGVNLVQPFAYQTTAKSIIDRTGAKRNPALSI